jgi:hypothetical protein
VDVITRVSLIVAEGLTHLIFSFDLGILLFDSLNGLFGLLLFTVVLISMGQLLLIYYIGSVVVLLEVNF